MKHEESLLQMQVVNHLRQFHPDVLFTASIQENASGGRTKTGKWVINLRQAGRRKAMGYKAGTPDLMIFEPRLLGQMHYKGLFVEMKTIKGTASEDQRIFLAELIRRGYKTAVCKGVADAVDTITAYLTNPKDY